MSGHSKWSTIKRKKGSIDAARGKVFGKITKEIIIAVREGGGDPLANTRLRTAVIKARSENMPNSNVERAISKALGDSGKSNYDEISYEGYAAGGVAIFVECVTENKNRTGPEVRHVFTKNAGNLGENGCVSYMFTRKGIILIEKTDVEESLLFELLIDGGVEDIQSSEQGYEVSTSPEVFNNIIKILEDNNIAVTHAEVAFVPDSYITLDEEATAQALNLIEQMEELDDVQSVSHNLELRE